VKVLLRKTGGFESFLAVARELDPNEPAVSNLPHGTRDDFGSGFGVMTAATVPAERHHSIARVDQLVSLGVVCLPWLEPVEPQHPEPLDSGVGLATLPHGHGFKARVEQRRKSLNRRPEKAVVTNERCDVRVGRRDNRPDQLHVLLRHRRHTIAAVPATRPLV
jgi:hypothetical protein